MIKPLCFGGGFTLEAGAVFDGLKMVQIGPDA
jgi:hypothetical protein